MSSTQEKVAIVTGGGQGIGKSIAMRFLTDGFSVVVAEIDPEAGEECISELASLGNIVFIKTDVSDEPSVKKCIKQTIAWKGRIDVLINNAGIGDVWGKIEELPFTVWQKCIDINLTGCFLTVKHATPHLKKTRGTIVNIASMWALQAEPNREAYAASKAGMVGLTQALAVSLGPEIRVNCISPGWIVVDKWKKKTNRKPPSLRPVDHEQHPVGRAGKPEDIAAMVAFLISDEAGFITGENYIIDGGISKKQCYAE